jgi:predicted amidophosphoribosyltransferase
MYCSNCRSENPAGKKFCEDCGAPLESRCPKCAAVTSAGKRFCGDCGASLEATAPAVAEPRYSGLTGERRYLMVVAGYQQAVAEATGRAGSHFHM